MGIRVVVVDGHPAMRVGLCAVFLSAGFQVLGEAASGEGGVELAKKERPELAVLGLNPRGEIGGVQAAERLKALPAPPRVLVYTAYNYPEDISACFLAGSDSFLHKSVSREDLVEAARRTAAGEPVWWPGERVGEARGSDGTRPGEDLTEREKEVLSLLLRRYTNAEIAAALYIEVQTVKNHVSRVLRKCGVGSRGELLSGTLDPAL